MTIPELIDRALARNPDAPALLAPSRASLSYDALRHQLAITAGALRDAGIGKNETVAVVLPNGPEMAVAVVAVASSAVCAPLNPNYRADEFRFYLGDLAAKALLLPANEVGPARAVAQKLGVRCLDVHWQRDAPAGRFEFAGFEPSATNDSITSPRSNDVALVMHTSGTTSRPKIVPLTHANLCSSALNVACTLQLSNEDRCLGIMPLFHIHGIVAALLAPLAAGGSVACTPGYRSGQFLPWLEEFHPTWITAVPSMYQAILAELAQHPAGIVAKRLRLARSSSAPLPPTVMRELEHVLQAPVIEAYGMTEAAHQIASNPLPPEPRKLNSVGMAAGPFVAVMDDCAQLLPPGGTGEIVIRGENVTRGYGYDAEGTTTAIAGEWFRTGDQGYIDADGYVFLTGRFKEIINRSGEKVSPHEVDDALLEHPAVGEAVTFGVRHEKLGEDVAAAVVLKAGAVATEDQIRAFLFGRLSEFKIPSQLVIVDAIPKGASGKVQRVALESKLAERMKPAFVVPRDAIEAQVADIFAQVMGLRDVGALDNFFALGGDSLRGTQALALLRDELKVEMSILDLFRAPTVAEMGRRIRDQLLLQWNDTAVDYPRDQCIHQLFEEQTARTPDVVAVVYEGTHLTYAELDARATQLGRHLQARGVGPDTPVGICLPRSIDLVVGVLAILKAGGAYVPLDPGYPASRLAFMLDDTRAPLVLTRQSLQHLVSGTGAAVICMDVDGPEIAQAARGAPRSEATAAHLAYVIYTSGSTGTPKGVAVSHRCVARLVFGADYVRFGAQQTFLLLAPMAFDASTFELWGALLHGSRCVIYPDAVPTARGLEAVIARHGVTTLWLTRALFNAIVDESPSALRGVRQLLTGGEALSVRHVRAALAALPETQIINGYGPTESTTFACCYPIPRALPADCPSVPIGRPIANTTAYVLDPSRQPVPLGVAGELYIGGDGLARGYWNRPGLTAERFVPDPFSTQPGARLYRTGDRVRYLPDGNIEFLGRFDSQLKLRGFRIEPGEIEALLRQQPQVREVVVQLREDVPGEPQLVTYVVTQGEALAAADLRATLKLQLPDYMIPAAFVQLPKLPLTPNGKIDRNALPAPEMNIGAEAASPPRGAAEETIAGIWCELLHCRRIGAHDNFFDLGGHSLLAIQLVARLRDVFGVELAVRALFEAPTLAEQAILIERTRHDADESALEQILGELERITDEEAARELDAVDARTPQISSAPRAVPLPLSFAQQRLWFLERLTSAGAAYNIAQALRLEGALDHWALEASLNAIVARHEVLRTTFAEQVGEPLQVVAPSLRLALAVEDLGALPAVQREAEARRLAQEDADTPFSLERGPLIRTRLLRLDEQVHVLVLVVHHIVADAWSMGVMLRELMVLYPAFIRGETPTQQPMPIHYADYAQWQRQRLQGDTLLGDLDYWTKTLAHVPLLRLPADKAPTRAQRFTGAREQLRLPGALTDALQRLSHGEGATLFMTLLAAFQLLLSRHSGQNDIAVGAPIAGRTHSETEGLIGFFVNTLVLRTDLSGNPAFRELLHRVREICLGAYTHQELPFEKLVEVLNPTRDLARNPLFDVMLNQVEAYEETLQLDGLRSESITLDATHSKFAMTLYVCMSASDISLDLVYQDALFSAERMAELLRQYRHLLTQIAEAPDQTILSYSLVTSTARARLPDPSAVIDAPLQLPVTRLVADWVDRQPDAIAVTQGTRRWSYRALADAANRLAQSLRHGGIGRGDVVAILGSRSFGLISSMLGVWLRGGVFVTIDSALPETRRNVMLREARAKAICRIGVAPLPDDWSATSASELVFDIDPDHGIDIRADLAQPAEAAPLPGIWGDDAAYIFFTSGSTGVPKGVLGCHQGLSHFLNWQRQTFDIGPRDHVAQLTSLSFDVLLRDVFLPLTSGGTLCIPEERDLAAPLAWLARERVTVVHTVPTLLQSWLAQEVAITDLPALRWLFLAGEPLSGALVKAWWDRFADSAEVINLYGPTETTLAKCFHRVAGEIRPGLQPVGVALPQTQVLVLSAAGQPCGSGELGEVVLRTPFRTLGYINAAEEMRRRFVPNPFRDGDQSDLLYYTGDRGRYRPDGTLDLLGRLDDQLKIRGVRVEPGEVQAALEEHPAVQACVVLGRKDVRGDDLLVAFIVTTSGRHVTIGELRSFLAGQLPSALVPSTWLFVDELPRLPNGKIDRSALPSPGEGCFDLAMPHVAPRTSIESQLADVWQEILGIANVGIHDNFFDVGGHSLKATQLISRIDRKFGVAVPLRQVFEAPTVAELAAIVERVSR